MSNKYYKLHPVAAIINFFKGLKELIVLFIIILSVHGFDISVDLNSENFWSEIIPLAIICIVTLAHLCSGILRWWTFVYWFEDNELRVKYGLFVKKKRYIPFDRIQSFNYKEGIFHRIFGLVQVMVETAGGSNGEAEVVLTAVTRNAANEIELVTRKEKETCSQLKDGQNEEVETVLQKEGPTIIYKMKTKDLVVLATTSNSIGVVLTGVLAAFSQFSQYIPYDKVFEELSTFIRFGVVTVIVGVFVAFLLAWIISVCITFINYYDFTVMEEEQRITVTRGLLEKKRVTIPINRIQAIKIVENPFRQLFHLVQVTVESASGGFSGKEKKITIFPLISKSKLYEPLEELFPELEWNVSLTKAPKVAKPFFYRIDFLWLIPIIIACSFIWYPYGLFSILLIIPIILLGLWQYRTAGFSISGNQLTLVYRVFSRVTFVVEKKRIQALECKQSYFQKRKRIATIQATVMSDLGGTSASGPNFRNEDVGAIMNWFEKSSKNDLFPKGDPQE